MQAPRLLSRLRHPFARGALQAACLWLAGAGLVAADARDLCVDGDGDWIARVCYTALPDAAIYGHAVLGDTPEWNEVTVHWGDVGQAEAGQERTTYAAANHVFEDIAPRLLDVDGDARPEVVVVQSAFTQGARLVVLDGAKLDVIATPYIGTRNRWLAPLGGADIDGDGFIELAFVDRPHLAQTLRIWRFQDEKLTQVAQLQGLTNHRIGEPDIAGGIRDCGAGPEMILATGNWAELVSVRWGEAGFAWTPLGGDTSRPAFARAMQCK